MIGSHLYNSPRNGPPSARTHDGRFVMNRAEQVQVTQADRGFRSLMLNHIADSLDRPCTDGDMIDDRQDILDAMIASFRHTAQSDALAVMREAREAIKNLREWIYGWDASFLNDADWPADDAQARNAVTKLTAAIEAMGEG